MQSWQVKSSLGAVRTPNGHFLSLTEDDDLLRSLWKKWWWEIEATFEGRHPLSRTGEGRVWVRTAPKVTFHLPGLYLQKIYIYFLQKIFIKFLRKIFLRSFKNFRHKSYWDLRKIFNKNLFDVFGGSSIKIFRIFLIFSLFYFINYE